MVRDRRYAVTTLASDMPAGPQGQPAHQAGAEVVLVESVQIEGLGGVGFPTPRPSELLLHAAAGDLKRATRLGRQCLSQAKAVRWTQPGIEHEITNDQLLFDFFGSAMAGLMLAYAAVDARLNELFTQPVQHKGERVPVEQVQGYWSAQRKLEHILRDRGDAWLGEEDVAGLAELKELRDMAVHVRTEHILGRYSEFTEDGGEKLLWSRLLNESNLSRFADLAERLLDGLRKG